MSYASHNIYISLEVSTVSVLLFNPKFSSLILHFTLCGDITLQQTEKLSIQHHT